jgi:succinate dehydrogenase hydrophobic anchor subunit
VSQTPGEATSDATASVPAGPAEVRSWGWHLLQLSSWLLLILLPVHLVTTWIIHDPATMGVARYAERWHSTGWRLFDWLFFMLALIHGGLGLDGLLASPRRNPRLRIVVSVGLGLSMTVLALALSAAIVSFDAS